MTRSWRRTPAGPHLRCRAVLVAAVSLCVVGGACAAPSALPPPLAGDYSQYSLPDGAEILPPTAVVPPPPPDPSSCGALSSLKPDPGLRPDTAPPGSALAAIVARGRLIVGTDQNTNLFSFRNPSTGTLSGFDVDLAREIARDLFGDPDKVEFRLLTSAGRFDALERNDVDLVVHATSITCERAARVGFSSVYFEAFQRLLVPEGSGITSPADLAGKRVCTFIDTTSLATIQRVAPGATIVAVPDWDDCLTTLQLGQADAATTDNSILAGLAAQDPNLEIVGPNLELEPYGVVANKNNDALVRFVNRTLERMRDDGTWNRLYDQWLSLLGPTAGPPTPSYRD
ncbi:glutamate ABC transporter substrate-binding protein [Rhodococcus sp. NCIMB 12038]|uniref:glutamate ABC transporter substrate-binding protein n=1 Tax=Rhodococcus sp. NCIMB 12038 TaxID=933800 RepID=UPI000B3CF28C|nr:glutamate ABC transporter substrate-binding protein [Rhodococcus sp. NCIMB 12038]OUS93878.1 ABC transporter substrate-binding protein [Rhodococcus sp. NCIMB 12038]